MKTLKERIYDLHDKGHFLDVSPIRIRGNKLLCRIYNPNTGGDLKLFSSITIKNMEKESEASD